MAIEGLKLAICIILENGLCKSLIINCHILSDGDGKMTDLGIPAEVA